MENSTSSIIGALGAGSGVNMAQLARDLSAARFAQRIARLEDRSELLETRISAASTLRSQLTELSSALGDRIRNGDLAARATISNTSVAVPGVVTGAAPRGSYSLEVQQLADSQTLVTNGYSAASDLVGEGTLAITFGSISGGGFTADAARSPLNITVSATDTLSDVATRINGAGQGLTAYVANGTNGAQLVIKGADGEANGFTLTGTGASQSGGGAAQGNIDYLNWSPATDTGQLRETAADALYTLDTVARRSTSNTLSDLPGGLTLSLTGTNVGSPATISFGNPTASISTVMRDFVGALNDVARLVQQNADPLTGSLGSDAGARRLKRELAQLGTTVVMPNAASGEPRTLGDLGLKTNRDGTFSLDNDRLTATLAASAEGAAAMFTTGLFGVFATVDNIARATANRGDPGTLAGSIVRYTSQSATIAEQLEEITAAQEALRAQLTVQLARSERLVTSSQSTLSFLQQQADVQNSRRG